MGFTHEEIERMIIDGDYMTVTDFQDDTFIGTGCGRCLPIVYDLFANKNPE
jgi:NAD(P)H-nitrite reductase large subunit